MPLSRNTDPTEKETLKLGEQFFNVPSVSAFCLFLLCYQPRNVSLGDCAILHGSLGETVGVVYWCFQCMWWQRVLRHLGEGAKGRNIQQSRVSPHKEECSTQNATIAPCWEICTSGLPPRTLSPVTSLIPGAHCAAPPHALHFIVSNPEAPISSFRSQHNDISLRLLNKLRQK